MYSRQHGELPMLCLHSIHVLFVWVCTLNFISLLGVSTRYVLHQAQAVLFCTTHTLHKLVPFYLRSSSSASSGLADVVCCTG